MPMQIIISTELRRKLMERYDIDKTAMSRILHFKSMSLSSCQIRSEILNFHKCLLV